MLHSKDSYYLWKNTKLEFTESQCNSPWLIQLQFKLHFILIILDL